MHEVMQLVILLLFALVLFAILMSKGSRRSHSYFKGLPLFKKHNTDILSDLAAQKQPLFDLI